MIAITWCFPAIFLWYKSQWQLLYINSMAARMESINLIFYNNSHPINSRNVEISLNTDIVAVVHNCEATSNNSNNNFLNDVWKHSHYMSIFITQQKTWVCHQGMLRPQVVEGGLPSNMEGSCEYIE
jgi:hypothetical protein